MSPEILKGAELLVTLIAGKTGVQLDGAQLAQAAEKLISAGIEAVNAWPNAKAAGKAEAEKITDFESAEKFNKEH